MAQQLVKSNPALTRGFSEVSASEDPMTMSGTINRTIALLGLLMAFGAMGWLIPSGGVTIVALVAAFGVAIWCSFSPKRAAVLGPLYAGLEGYVLGDISKYYNDAYQGIVLEAIGLSLAIFIGLLLIYRTGVIKVTTKFRTGVMAATLGVALYYVASLITSAFGGSLPLVNSSSNYGIIFSVLVICLASANLVVDFDFIERGVRGRAPAYMEWYGAFGLMVTLVWLYLELLRLLGKLNQR